MKRNDLILVATTLLFSVLFYRQVAGINFLLFNIVLIIALVLKDKKVLQYKTWRLAACGALLSSVCVLLYGNIASVIVNAISLALLSGLSFSPASSVIVSVAFTFISSAFAYIFMIVDLVNRENKDSVSAKPKQRSLLIIIPIAVTLIFFCVYRSASPLFSQFSDKIIDLISWGWFFFTLMGFILLYGFFYHKRLKQITDMDENTPVNLSPKEYAPYVLFGKPLSVNEESFSGIMLFVLLNLLILIVNALDFNYIFISHTLPEGLKYSEFLHQGVGALILSIIMAVAIILFYFRGALNFYENNKTIKYLAYLWILQNMFMLFSTAFKNNIYIHEYGLTYKRIGVYVYLLLTLIGLAVTFNKILRTKANIYLFHINGWLFYGVYIIFCFFNWDNIITVYNVTHPKGIDYGYLLDLAYSNVPDLLTVQQSTIKYPETDSSDASLLYEKVYSFLQFREKYDWQSWCYDNNRIYNQLAGANRSMKIKKLQLNVLGIESLKPLEVFSNIQVLDLSSNRIENLNDISSFPMLKKLELAGNRIYSLKGIEKLHQLEFLDLCNNPITDYVPLYTLNNLKELYVCKVDSAKLEVLKEHLPNTHIVMYP